MKQPWLPGVAARDPDVNLMFSRSALIEAISHEQLNTFLQRSSKALFNKPVNVFISKSIDNDIYHTYDI